jgi:hypothetical protein
VFGNCIGLYFSVVSSFNTGVLMTELFFRVGAIRVTGGSELDEQTALVGVGMAARGCRLSLS